MRIEHRVPVTQNSTNKSDSSTALREQLRNMNKKTEPERDPKKPIVFQGQSESVISRAQKHTEGLRMDRMNSQKTAQAVKKMKYNFKNVSSRVLLSKTSQAAKQAAGQANREVQRLKRAKMSGNYENEELDAAIAHAKAVERIAKKKVKHLQAEELAQAASRNHKNEDREESSSGQESLHQTAEYAKEEAIKTFEEDPQMRRLTEELAEEASEEMIDVGELTENLMEDLSEAYEKMLEDLGLEDMADMMMASKGDMTEDEIRMMKTEHRNKEVRDLMKADMEYLKAMFDRMEKQQQAASAANISSNAAMPVMTSGVEAPQEALARVMPSIDLTM